MSHAHVAGSIHADAETRAPGWLARPDDVNALLTRLWSANVDQERRRNAHRCRARGRRDRGRGRHARSYVVDELDLRDRARAFADRVRRLGRLLRRQVVRLHRRRPVGGRGGPRRRRLYGRRAGRGPPRRGRAAPGSGCTATTRAPRRSGPRWKPGSAGSSSTPSTRSAGCRRLAAELGVRPRVMVRVTTGVEAHTHAYIATAHEDQKFGFSIAAGEAAGRCRPASTIPASS